MKSRSKIDPVVRFMRNVNKTSTCWLWTKALDKDGYGKFWNNKLQRSPAAHRTAYELFVGMIPNGLLVCHTCDNPSCVNPRHLFLGTIKDNNNDRTRKNRQAKGSRSGPAKLTEAEVLALRREYAQSTTYKRSSFFAKKYNITPGHVRHIITRRLWRHI